MAELGRLGGGAVAAALVFAAAHAARAQESDGQDGRWRFATGVDYSVGDYGEDEDTAIVVIPFTAAYVAPRWSVSATLPYASIDGPGGVVPDSGGGFGSGGSSAPILGPLLFGADPDVVAPGTDVSESGLADARLSASVAPVETQGGFRLTLKSGLRLPTGDETRSLGTGEAAGSVSAGVSQRLGRAALYGVLGAERAFDSGADGVFAGAGVEGYVGDRTLLGSSLSWSEATDARLRDAAEASLYAGFDLNPSLQLRAYGEAGLTETSPDFGAGLRVVIK